MDKGTALQAVMLSGVPHVGDKGAERILTMNQQRAHGLATFFRLPAAVLRDDYKLVYRQGLTLEEALPKLELLAASCEEVMHYNEFIKNSSRGIIR